MSSAYISSFFVDSGIQFDFYQPDYYAAKYRDIISHIVRDPTRGAIAGGYFTKYLAVTDRKCQGIDVYVFIPPSNSTTHAYEASAEARARAEQLDSYLAEPFNQLPFERNPFSQPDCESSIKSFYVSNDFRAPSLEASLEQTPKCPQKVTVRFTTLPSITQLISHFDYEPCKIGYRIGQRGPAIYFGEWYMYGGRMNRNNSAPLDLISKYVRKGFNENFNGERARDINALLE